MGLDWKGYTAIGASIALNMYTAPQLWNSTLQPGFNTVWGKIPSYSKETWIGLGTLTLSTLTLAYGVYRLGCYFLQNTTPPMTTTLIASPQDQRAIEEDPVRILEKHLINLGVPAPLPTGRFYKQADNASPLPSPEPCIILNPLSTDKKVTYLGKADLIFQERSFYQVGLYEKIGGPEAAIQYLFPTELSKLAYVLFDSHGRPFTDSTGGKIATIPLATAERVDFGLIRIGIKGTKEHTKGSSLFDPVSRYLPPSVSKRFSWFVKNDPVTAQILTAGIEITREIPNKRKNTRSEGCAIS